MLNYKNPRTALFFICLAACIAALLSSGCESVDTPPANPALTGTSWTVTETSFPTAETERPNSGDFVINFLETGQITGNELCNACGGTYTLIGNDTIEINAGCDESACALWSTAYIVRAYPNGLYTYAIDGNMLVLNQVAQPGKFVLEPALQLAE